MQKKRNVPQDIVDEKDENLQVGTIQGIVFTRVSAAVRFKFLVFKMRCLFGGGACLRAALFKKT